MPDFKSYPSSPKKLVPAVLLLLIGVYLVLSLYHNWWPWGVRVLFQLTPIPTPGYDITNWQTYRNEEHGFEVRYPVDWILRPPESSGISLNSPENEALLEDIKVGRVYGEGYLDDLIINVYGSINDLPVNQYGGKYTSLEEYIYGDSLISEQNRIIFSGQSAYEVVQGGFGAYYTILVEKDGRIYEIFWGNKWQKADLTMLDNKILSTFKFVELSSKILLTPKNTKKYNDRYGCNIEFNYDTPNTHVEYKDSNRGLLMNIPFNTNWGNEMFRLEPYDETESAKERVMSFGAIAPFEGCGWIREYFIVFKPARSAEAVIEEVNSNNPGNLSELRPHGEIINGLTVVKWEVLGLCSEHDLEVIGRKNNYELHKICNTDYSELENLVKTIKLID